MHRILFFAGACALSAAVALGAHALQPEQPININTATAEELEELPRVGKATAARIIEWRDENGPFSRVEELLNIQGIGERTFERIKPHVTVGGDAEDRPGTPLDGPETPSHGDRGLVSPAFSA